MRNSERMGRLRECLNENRWDALVCALPSNVLLISGYWPIIGTGVAVVSSEGEVSLIAPEDERELARHSWANRVQFFQPGSLDRITTAAEAICGPLAQLLGGTARIGYEAQAVSEPASYIAMNLYGGGMRGLLAEASPHAALESADDALARLRSVKTPFEVDAIRTACGIAHTAFQTGVKQMAAGVTEVKSAAAFNEPLACAGLSEAGVTRAGGHVSCISGVHSGNAYGAFARSTSKPIQAGDLVLTHCNSQANGYWTDITRTYAIGGVSDRQREMYSALFAARDAALQAIAPGVAASDVDGAARHVLDTLGFGARFKHSTGHGVGFGAIDANALPRIHPKSPGRLEEGMVFNIEPGIYFEDYGGMRHCDMVALTARGAELLTPFQSHIEDLAI
ncbi:MAG: Xaa-Pro peptidase family protein [Acidobacteriota bacterium]|nr:Xaa-Pro peptidase family protein [Acidobacteriota bacterium]